MDHHALHECALAKLQQNNITDAIKLIQQAVELAPKITLYRRNLGELLRRTGELSAAINALKLTIEMEPEHAENHFLLGLAYNDNRQFNFAVHHYHIALSYNQNYGLAWNNLGASLESLGDKCNAKIAYTTAIALNPQHVEALNNLGVIYSEEGRINEASAYFAAAIAAKPDFIDAHYNLSLIKTYTPDDPHLAYVKSMQPKLNYYPLYAQIRYYFTLGKAFDDVKQYKNAFDAYSKGNRLYYLNNPWDKTKLEEIVDFIPIIFTQSFLKQIQKTESICNPIFIVGMPRSGTTLIEQILSSHESIYGAGELNILHEVIQAAWLPTKMPFNDWVSQLKNEEFVMLGEQYLNRISKLSPDKKFIIDKMPSNCFYIGMIYRMLPNAKIIHAMRDPMDSCFSCYTHLFKENMAFAYDLETLGDYYSLYARTMKHWYAVLPEKTIFDVPYEKMVENGEQLSKQLVEFLGLSWDENCHTFYNNKREVKTASLVQVRKPIYNTSVKRWQHFADRLQPLLNKVNLKELVFDNYRSCNARGYAITE